MIKPVMTWAEINTNWAHLMETLRSRLPVNEELALNSQGEFVKAPRPMLEDIVCARASRDVLLIKYLNAAHIDISLSEAREPKVIDTNARNKIGFGQGGKRV